MDVKEKVELSEIKREIDLLLLETFIARFECDKPSTEMTLLNGQKFIVSVKEV